MKSKPSRVKARQPRGFVDRSAADLYAQDRMLATIRHVYETYGFEPVETPFFEYTDALGKFLPDSDRPNEGVFSLQDDDEEWLSLRYDLTAPLARHVAENFEDLPKPYRSYRAGYVFRNEKPGPGRFRQFMQFDADIVGAPNVSADAEMAMMMADTMEALGIPRGQYVIRVNNRKVLDGVLEAIGLIGDEQASRRLTVLRAMDKLDKFGPAGVRDLLGIGRRDESGDFTPGANLTHQQANAVLRVLSAESLSDLKSALDQVTFDTGGVPDPNGGLGHLTYDDAVNTLIEEFEPIVRAVGYGPDRIKIDPSVVRGLEYYTGIVFEAELLFDVLNDKGQKVQFGSVGGGGRYDGLVSRFLSTPVPATGFSIGVSRLQSALKNLDRLEDTSRIGPVVVTVMDRNRMADYQAMATRIRRALNGPGKPLVAVEVFQGNPKQFGKQLQYADRREAPVAVIQGGDEKANGKVQVKDLALGKALSAGVDDNAEWREMRAGQSLIDEADLVAVVRSLLRKEVMRRPKLAIPSKGRLKTQSFEILSELGITVRGDENERSYAVEIDHSDLDVVLMSASQIARELYEGSIDFGITGEDLIYESGTCHADFVEIEKRLGFGTADVVIAAPVSLNIRSLEDFLDFGSQVERVRIATKYDRLTRDFMSKHPSVRYEIIHSQGATEGAPAANLADVIVDITSTGSTLRANGLIALSDPILRSQAVLARSRAAMRHLLS